MREARRPLPRYPGIKVDVAVAVPESTRAGELVALVESAGKGQVADVELFDLYRGKSIGEGKEAKRSSIPKDIGWFDAPDTWWWLVEDVSWEAWVTQHLPTVMPECNLPAPSAVSKP